MFLTSDQSQFNWVCYLNLVDTVVVTFYFLKGGHSYFISTLNTYRVFQVWDEWRGKSRARNDIFLHIVRTERYN